MSVRSRVLAISPDSRWLASAGDDGTAQLWDLSSLDPSADPVVLRGHEGSVNALAIGPDGRWLVTGSRDGTAQLWHLKIDDLIDLACRVAGRNLTDLERSQFFGDESGRETCPGLPVGP